MASPFFFVKKKDGSLRPTQDYRKLNNATIKNRYPLPLISELIDKTGHAKIFSKMDVRWGYNNIRIKEDDKWKAAFRTNLGLSNPQLCFSDLPNPCHLPIIYEFDFKPLIDRGVVAVYMDDILFLQKTNDSTQLLFAKYSRFYATQPISQTGEMCFHQPEVEYLGLIIGNKQARIDPTKVSAIRDWPVPTRHKNYNDS